MRNILYKGKVYQLTENVYKQLQECINNDQNDFPDGIAVEGFLKTIDFCEPLLIIDLDLNEILP
jgi:hypothetical protein